MRTCRGASRTAAVVRAVPGGAITALRLGPPPSAGAPSRLPLGPRCRRVPRLVRGQTCTQAEPEGKAAAAAAAAAEDEVEESAEGKAADHLMRADSVAVDGTPEGNGWQRWAVVFAMFAAFILCNMDKVNMSVAIPAGYLATRLGGATVLLAGVALWSFGTMIAPPASQYGLVALCATRVLVGLGEGLAPSAVTNVLANTIPVRERARAVSTVFGGLDVGSACGLLLCGPLIASFGWPSVFYVFAGLGFLWCLVWPRLKIPFLLSSAQHPETKKRGGRGK
eukprot:jgi/Tetstr1/460932/TSEL_006084.t1